MKKAIQGKGYFNIFVNKVLKKKGKLLYLEDIEDMLSGIMGENYSRAKAYKVIHQAKNRGHIVSLKKDLYYIPQNREQEDEIIQKWYWHILHTHIKTYLGGSGLITGTTALNLMIQNYEIPDMINITSNKTQCVEVVVRDKKVAIKKMMTGSQPLFTTLKKTAKKITIRNKSFYTTSLGVSLMETLFANGQDTLQTNELCKKILRKYWKQIDWEEIVALLRKGKYHSSINKLYYLARALDDAYANHIMSIIKRHSYRMGATSIR